MSQLLLKALQLVQMWLLTNQEEEMQERWLVGLVQVSTSAEMVEQSGQELLGVMLR